MRLSEEEKEAIKDAVRRVFGEDAIVRLFGSCVDDRRKGGDIDLHLEVPKGKSSLDYELRFQLELLKALGERKVDVVVYAQGAAVKPIDEIAFADGDPIVTIDDGALSAFTENLESARQVAQRPSSSIARLKSVFPLSSDVINDIDEATQESLDAFVKRFERLQDIIEGRLFRGIAYLEQEDVTRLSRRDLTMLMEKLGAIGSANSWSTLSLLRNKLAHE